MIIVIDKIIITIQIIQMPEIKQIGYRINQAHVCFLQKGHAIEKF